MLKDAAETTVNNSAEAAEAIAFFDLDVGKQGRHQSSGHGGASVKWVPVKNWRFRKQLFSRFDKGIQFDVIGFQSAKSEVVADFVARHLPGNRVLDAFTGIGGSTIGFAKAGKQVVSIEIVEERSRMAAHNAAIYGVDRRIRFEVGDTVQLWRRFDFDAAYFDPPWGGLGYEWMKSLRFGSFMPNVIPLIKAVLAQGKHVAVTLPLNFDLNDLKQIPWPAKLYYGDQYKRPYCIHCFWLVE